MSLAPSSPAIRSYDRIAPRYDRLHRLWLRHAGGEAQSALEAATRAVLRPGMKLLDAGCGTGAFARRLVSKTHPRIDMTLLDPSEAMLARCADLPVRRVAGRLEKLPFADASFDILTCAWALETTTCPDRAMAEMRRVIRTGGVICLAFCADQKAGNIAGWLMRHAVRARRTGVFLKRSFVENAISNDGEFSTYWLPCRGPVGALLAQKSDDHSAKRGKAGSCRHAA
jgi:ubiquinone/menaquinone biosynthesis C-methylase UbiE